MRRAPVSLLIPDSCLSDPPSSLCGSKPCASHHLSLPPGGITAAQHAENVSYLHGGQEPVGLVAARAHGGLGEDALCGQAWPVAEDPFGSGGQHSDSLKKRHKTQQPQRQEDPTTWESEATDIKKPVSNPIYCLRKIRNNSSLYFNNHHTTKQTFLLAQTCEF